MVSIMSILRAIAHALCYSAVIFALMCAGCGEVKKDYAYVKGKVTLDGEPLANVRVEFQPEKGPPSYGATDESGAYQLRLSDSQQGAKVGRHTIRITTIRPKSDDPRAKKVPIVEQIPAQYNTRSKQIREIEPGSNRIDFDLTTP